MIFRIVGEGAKTRYYVDGVQVTKAKFDAALPNCKPGPKLKRRSRNLAFAHGQPSDAFAVHPDQIPAVVERNRKHGLYVEYDRHGSPLIKSRAQGKKLVEAEGRREPSRHVEKPAIDPRTASACKFLDNTSGFVRGQRRR